MRRIAISKRQALQEQRRNARLLADLTKFVSFHYGSPMRGRRGMVGYAENYAALSAAATLIAMLTNGYEIRR